jgi:hypothetical protein
MILAATAVANVDVLGGSAGSVNHTPETLNQKT